jgi:hypothetical protein
MLADGCLFHARDLRIVGRDFASIHGVEFEILQFMGQDGYHKSMVEGACHDNEEPLHLGLEEVLVCGEVHPHPTCQLPQLQRLLWLQPKGDVVGFCNKFQTITELRFYVADYDVVE